MIKKNTLKIIMGTILLIFSFVAMWNQYKGKEEKLVALEEPMINYIDRNLKEYSCFLENIYDKDLDFNNLEDQLFFINNLIPYEQTNPDFFQIEISENTNFIEKENLEKLQETYFEKKLNLEKLETRKNTYYNTHCVPDGMVPEEIPTLYKITYNKEKNSYQIYLNNSEKKELLLKIEYQKIENKRILQSAKWIEKEKIEQMEEEKKLSQIEKEEIAKTIEKIGKNLFVLFEKKENNYENLDERITFIRNYGYFLEEEKSLDLILDSFVEQAMPDIYLTEEYLNEISEKVFNKKITKEELKNYESIEKTYYKIGEKKEKNCQNLQPILNKISYNERNDTYTIRILLGKEKISDSKILTDEEIKKLENLDPLYINIKYQEKDNKISFMSINQEESKNNV